MYLVAGLGNPEDKYLKTFHNMGFMAIDVLAEKLEIKFNKKECKAITCATFIEGEKIILAKPLTYMNSSGESINELMSKYKIATENLIIIYDDFDLPKGNLRIKASGSAGTHNGMKSIIACINSQNFSRIRIGINDNNVDIPIMNYVLSNIKKDDCELFSKAFDNSASAVLSIIKTNSTEEAMARYNGIKNKL